MTDESDRTAISRRDALKCAGGVLAAAGGVAGAAGTAAGAPITRTVIAPEVEQYRNNYTGQFALVMYASEEVGGVPDAEGLTNCQYFSWPREETKVYAGMLVDRLNAENPQAVQVPFYTDGRNSDIAPGHPFIINGQFDCGEQYVSLELEEVPSDVAGGIEPRGPTITATEAEANRTEGDQGGDALGTGGQPGFGPLLGLTGVAGFAALRELVRRR